MERLRNWVHSIDGVEYPVVCPPTSDFFTAHTWERALTYAQYQGREWVVREMAGEVYALVGCEPGLGYHLRLDLRHIAVPESS